jgi:hypothetical protein
MKASSLLTAEACPVGSLGSRKCDCPERTYLQVTGRWLVAVGDVQDSQQHDDTKTLRSPTEKDEEIAK